MNFVFSSEEFLILLNDKKVQRTQITAALDNQMSQDEHTRMRNQSHPLPGDTSSSPEIRMKKFLAIMGKSKGIRISIIR